MFFWDIFPYSGNIAVAVLAVAVANMMATKAETPKEISLKFYWANFAERRT